MLAKISTGAITFFNDSAKKLMELTTGALRFYDGTDETNPVAEFGATRASIGAKSKTSTVEMLGGHFAIEGELFETYEENDSSRTTLHTGDDKSGIEEIEIRSETASGNSASIRIAALGPSDTWPDGESWMLFDADESTFFSPIEVLTNHMGGNTKVTARSYFSNAVGVSLHVGSGGSNHGIYSEYAHEWIIRMNTEGKVASPKVYDETTSSDSVVRIDKNGVLKRYASSSKRYKKEIADISDKTLDPSKLYNIRVVQFKYKDDHLDPSDQRAGMLVNGFIAEELEETYPIAVNYENGRAEDWESRFIIPPMLKLIQEQHEQIEGLTKRIERLEHQVGGLA